MSNSIESHQLARSIPLMLLCFAIVFGALPLYVSLKDGFIKGLKELGVKEHHNYTGGKIIAEFKDKHWDLLRRAPKKLERPGMYEALDLVKLQIAKVEFDPWSPISLPARINFIFHFGGNQINPEKLKHGFSLPTLHVYVQAPGHTFGHGDHDKLIKAKLQGPGYSHQIIISPYFDQAKIYDFKGKYLGKGVSMYLKQKKQVIYGSSRLEKPSDTPFSRKKLTVGIPISLLGDPEQGRWSYYVALGLSDPNTPTQIRKSETKHLPEIYDVINPRSIINIELSRGPRPQILPLMVQVH